jgi:surfactin synthase thioesterase subunit
MLELPPWKAEIVLSAAVIRYSDYGEGPSILFTGRQKGSMSADYDLWIRRYHPRPDSLLRLVCLPRAGGSASFFYPLSASLPATAEALAVQYPGRQGRRTEPCAQSIGALAGQVAAGLRESEDDRPLALFGHSMGSVLAFEVAVRLEQDGGAPLAGVIASGRRSPTRHVDERVHLRDDAGLLAEIAA